MKKIGFIGAGNMATALICGLLRTGRWKPPDLWASDPLEGQLRKLRRHQKVEGCKDNRALVRGSATVILAVKPRDLPGVLEDIRPEVTPRKLFISIAAGFPLRRLEPGLGGQVRVVRAMPNTPVLVGKGTTVVVPGSHATPADVTSALRIFRAVGTAEAVTGEDLLDAVTGLSGSGPAFVYLFAESLAEGGVRGGLSQSLAARLAHQTIVGAGAMLCESGMSPRELRDLVTSPGGTTEAGLACLEEARVREAAVAAVETATRRARELATS